MHIRSASIIEIFGRKDVALNPDVPTLKFSYTNRFGIKEPMIAALHYCATLDVKYDSEMIKKEIIKPAAQWYCDWAEWVCRTGTDAACMFVSADLLQTYHGRYQDSAYRGGKREKSYGTAYRGSDHVVSGSKSALPCAL